ncbi:hypothetical protein LTR56_010388 [Elasticomyces elasticus]|nr:hypothetical protein LTR56_010388 [Elasticomyces elasticus]KAK3656955.1 hypothetical protein LTR22_009618 [Elasticomyces elasticus]KAK4926042.1 hypothetical protein LTR49_006956 [Elasticomyces elasticus]KAK5766187.1 hypothetical protein LTS12_003671 [Elasticomyces elasticus]
MATRHDSVLDLTAPAPAPAPVVVAQNGGPILPVSMAIHHHVNAPTGSAQARHNRVTKLLGIGLGLGVAFFIWGVVKGINP